MTSLLFTESYAATELEVTGHVYDSAPYADSIVEVYLEGDAAPMQALEVCDDVDDGLPVHRYFPLFRLPLEAQL